MHKFIRYRKKSLTLSVFSIAPLLIILTISPILSIYFSLGDGRVIEGVLNGWYVITYNYLFNFSSVWILISKSFFTLFMFVSLYFQLRIKNIKNTQALFVVIAFIAIPLIILNFSGFDYSDLQNIPLKNGLNYYRLR